MTTDKLKQIVDRQNEHLEQQAVDRATEIISKIGRLKSDIANAEAQIKELQKCLKELEITQLDPVQILGA